MDMPWKWQHTTLGKRVVITSRLLQERLWCQLLQKISFVTHVSSKNNIVPICNKHCMSPKVSYHLATVNGMHVTVASMAVYFSMKKPFIRNIKKYKWRPLWNTVLILYSLKFVYSHHTKSWDERHYAECFFIVPGCGQYLRIEIYHSSRVGRGRHCCTSPSVLCGTLRWWSGAGRTCEWCWSWTNRCQTPRTHRSSAATPPSCRGRGRTAPLVAHSSSSVEPACRRCHLARQSISRHGYRDSDCRLLQMYWSLLDADSGLDIGYVPAGPDAFFRWPGQFGPQQLIFYWPAGPVDFFIFIFLWLPFIFDKMLRGWLLNNLIIGLCANCRFMQIIFRRASLVLR